MLIPEFYDQWPDRMEDYLNIIDEDIWNCIAGGTYSTSVLQHVGTAATNPDVAQQTKKQQKNEKRCMCELRGPLPPVVYKDVHSCNTSKEIWDTLNNKYQRSNKTKISSVKQYLLELGEFKKK